MMLYSAVLVLGSQPRNRGNFTKRRNRRDLCKRAPDDEGLPK